MIPTKRKISVTKYTTPIFLVVSFIVIVVLLEYRRAIAGSFDGLKGGSQAGLALAYTGSLLLVAAQFYTIVKRSAWIGFIKTVGGVRPGSRYTSHSASSVSSQSSSTPASPTSSTSATS